jgi:type VI secretion system protein VasG
MMNVNFANLVGRLNSPMLSAFESASELCLSRRHYEVDIEHLLLRLVEAQDSDVIRILRFCEINAGEFQNDLRAALDRLKTGNPGNPILGDALIETLLDAWTIGSLDFQAGRIRSGFVVLAILSNPARDRRMKMASPLWIRVKAERLAAEFGKIVAGSAETEAPVLAPSGVTAEKGAAAPGAGGGFLARFTIDLTEQARIGKVDPVLGRDNEIRQLVDILMRRRQNNPILTGEPGVGKTAVVEGFALRVAAGDVPEPLRGVSIHSFDLTLLQAGAGVQGEFESRLKGLIEEVKSSAKPIILFIDEAHTMIGAGGREGQGDAANILKPALARGELRTIAATTWSEYKKYFERDAALARRFQVIKVEEPDEHSCVAMLRALVPVLEKHHNVRINDSALTAAARLSHRYIAGRQLPDKAVSVLDTACARVAIGHNAVPGAIEDLRRRLDALAVEARVLNREVSSGADHAERLAAIDLSRTKAEAKLAVLEARWDRESALVGKIRGLRNEIEASGEVGERSEKLSEIGTSMAELEQLQGQTPLVRVFADTEAVSDVISGWTGIPVGKMVTNEIQSILDLPAQLQQRVIGQDHAMDSIHQRIQTSRANLEDPNKPVGVFLLIGPSGVGKTETALALADLLYGGERNLITINLSEFQEAHTVSTLKGAPPGYVGFGQGGVLTEAVRKRPYSVVLLDEAEKAHPDVLELFFRVFDQGVMEDGEGRVISFRNTVILLTSNAATDTMMKLCADPETMPSPKGLVEAIKPELNRIFKPAFLGRMVVVPYYPLRDEPLRMIVRLKLGRIARRTEENNRVRLVWDDSLVNAIAERCTEVESGARNVDNILTNTVLPAISRLLLTALANREVLESIHVGVDGDGELSYTPQKRGAETGVAASAV